MNCNEIREQYRKNKERIRELNAAKVRVENDLPESQYKTPEEVGAWMKSEFGMSELEVSATLNSYATPEGRQKLMELERNMVEEGVSMGDQIVETRKTEGIEPFWRIAWDKARNAVDAVVNNIPKGVDAIVDAWMKRIAGRLSAESIGKNGRGQDVYVGTAVHTELKTKIEKLMEVDTVKATGLSRKQVDEALTYIGHARSDDISATLSRYSKDLLAKESDPNASPAFRVARENIENAKRLYDSSPEVKNFMGEYFDRLDTISREMERSGIFEKGRKSYFHNIVSLMDRMDPIDRAMFGKKFQTSTFDEAKKYNNGIEYVIAKGKLPASQSFLDNASFYNSQVAKTVRVFRIADELKHEAMNPDAKSAWTITDNGYVRRVLVGRPGGFEGWEPPTATSGRRYMSMEAINPKLRNVYAHPDWFNWASNAFGPAPQYPAMVNRITRGFGMWKQGVLGFGLGPLSFHGMSLTYKQMAQGAALGTENWFRPSTVVGKGMKALANYDARALELIDSGMVVGQHDAQALIQTLGKIDVQTGQKNVVGKLAGFFSKQHEWLFGRWQPGMKVGLGLEIMDTPWFKEMEMNRGRQYALQATAKLLNDTMGGQNLAVMGRSKFVQTILQTVFLAPDWQESKIRRIAGALGGADQPEIRTAYRKAILTQVAMMGMTHYALVKLAEDAGWIPPQSDDELIKDIAKGNFGRPLVGRTKDGKDVRARVFGAFIEDTRPFINLWRGYYESYTGHDLEGKPINIEKMGPAGRIYKPLLADVWTEFKNKMSPPLRIPIQAEEEFRQARQGIPNKKGEFKPVEPSPFDTSITPLPIPVQQAYYALRGGYEKDPQKRLMWAILAGTAGTVGVPLETSKSKAYAEQQNKKLRRKGLTMFKEK